MNETLQEMRDPRYTPTPWDRLAEESTSEESHGGYKEIGRHVTGQNDKPQDAAAPEIETLDQ